LDFASPRAASAFARPWRDKQGVPVATAACVKAGFPRRISAKAGLLDSSFIIPTFFDYLYALLIQ
jgi:hypothetical protein